MVLLESRSQPNNKAEVIKLLLSKLFLLQEYIWHSCAVIQVLKTALPMHNGKLPQKLCEHGATGGCGRGSTLRKVPRLRSWGTEPTGLPDVTELQVCTSDRHLGWKGCRAQPQLHSSQKFTSSAPILCSAQLNFPHCCSRFCQLCPKKALYFLYTLPPHLVSYEAVLPSLQW